MLDTTLSHLAQLTEGQLIGEDALFSSVSTDTRHIEKGALFVALVGERFDAHHFCQQALQAGASALLVERALETACCASGCPRHEIGARPVGGRCASALPDGDGGDHRKLRKNHRQRDERQYFAAKRQGTVYRR